MLRQTGDGKKAETKRKPVWVLSDGWRAQGNGLEENAASSGKGIDLILCTLLI